MLLGTATREDVTLQGYTFSRIVSSTFFDRYDNPSALLITPSLPDVHCAGPDKWPSAPYYGRAGCRPVVVLEKDQAWVMQVVIQHFSPHLLQSHLYQVLALLRNEMYKRTSRPHPNVETSSFQIVPHTVSLPLPCYLLNT